MTGYPNSPGGKVLLDGGVIDLCLDGHLPIDYFSDCQIMTTDILELEISAMPACKKERMLKLLSLASNIIHIKVPPNGFCFDVEGLGWGSDWSFNSELHNKMHSELVAMDKKSKSKKVFGNQHRDVSFAMSAIKHDATLITCDKKLHDVTKSNGGKALHFPKPKLSAPIEPACQS